MKVTRRTTLTYDVTEEEHEKLMSGLALLARTGDAEAGRMLFNMGQVGDFNVPYIIDTPPDLHAVPRSMPDTNCPPAGHTPESFAALPVGEQIKLLAAQAAAAQPPPSTSKPVVVDDAARQRAADEMGRWGHGSALPTQMEDDR